MISQMYLFKIIGFARIPLYPAGLTADFTMIVGVDFNMVYIRDQRLLVSPTSSRTVILEPRCYYLILGLNVTLIGVQHPVDLYLRIAQ